MSLWFHIFTRLFPGKTKERRETDQHSPQTNATIQIKTEINRPQPHTHNDEILQEYLRTIIRKYGHLRISVLERSSREIVIPLEEVYTRPRVVPDQPVSQLSPEQEELLQKDLLDQFKQHPDLSEEEYEDQIQQLRYRWKNMPRSWQKQNMAIELEEIVRQCSAEKPIAVILGEPGSGKSTVLRWFAIQMANTLLLTDETHPIVSTPALIPLVIDINDYARSFDKNQNLSFAEFLKMYSMDLIPPDHQYRLLDELERGHCLILLDQLDEIPDTQLRVKTMREIVSFITTSHAKRIDTETEAAQFNAIIVASRSTGYDNAIFEQSTHYTLLDFKEKQIEDFLDCWCPIIERFYRDTKQNNAPVEEPSPESLRSAREQKSKLLAIIKANAGIRRLALNPYMLTILAQLHRSNLKLPHRRIELYEAITNALMRKEKLGNEEEDLAREILGALAFQLHKLGASLKKQEIRDIIRETISVWKPCPPEEVSENTVERYLETPCLSSGLLILSGDDVYNFKHPTLREYFVASHLMTFAPKALTQFMLEHFRRANWHEPLRLVIAYKSGYRGKHTKANNRTHAQANDLIRAILTASDPYDAILHRNLFFATKSLVDCLACSMERQLQEQIANTLFDLYGDSFGAGRYLKLQHEIEEIVLSWLSGQVQEPETNAFSPLIDAWHTALTNHQLPIRQEGAIHLLTTLAPDLEGYPPIILEKFIPVLLQLAGLQDLTYQYFPNTEAKRLHVSQPQAIAASGIIEDYAFIALRLFDKAGPAGWIYQKWIDWSQEKPELLERLTRHSDELEHLLSPAAFPGKPDNKWDDYMTTVFYWQVKKGYEDPYRLQSNLLSFSETARYPHAILLYELLNIETDSPSNKWPDTWINYLNEEMCMGRNATYQAALSLRLLLSRHNPPRQREIAKELRAALVFPGPIQRQALIAMINIYHPELDQPMFYRDMRYLNNSLGLLKTLHMRYILECIDSFSFIKLNDAKQHQLLRDMKETEFLQTPLDGQDPRSLRSMRRNYLEPDRIIEILCALLKEASTPYFSTVLFALYCLIAANPPRGSQKSLVQESLKHFEDSIQVTSTEQRILIGALTRLLNGQGTDTSDAGRFPGGGAISILENTLTYLKQLQELEKYQIEEILNACGVYSLHASAWNILRISWEILSTQYTICEDAFSVIIEALNDENVMVCAAAALLLQHCKALPFTIRDEAIPKIIALLNADTWSRLPLNPLGSRKISLLDDVLFDTLKVLVASHD